MAINIPMIYGNGWLAAWLCHTEWLTDCLAEGWCDALSPKVDDERAANWIWIWLRISFQLKWSMTDGLPMQLASEIINYECVYGGPVSAWYIFRDFHMTFGDKDWLGNKWPSGYPPLGLCCKCRDTSVDWSWTKSLSGRPDRETLRACNYFVAESV